MPHRLGLSHKKTHRKSVAATCESDSSDVPCEVATQTDDSRMETVDATIQTDDTPGFIVNCSRTVTQADALHLMSPLPGSCVVQYPLEIFCSLKLESVYQLKQRLQNTKCLNNWFPLRDEISSEVVKLVKIDERKVFTVEVLSDLQWNAVVPNKHLFPNMFNGLPSTITTIKDLQLVLSFLSGCTICSGNADPKFAPIVAKSKGIFKDRTGMLDCLYTVAIMIYNFLGSKINAYYDHQFHTIRHSNCEWIVINNSDGSKCDVCKQYRISFLNGKLRILQNRLEEQECASYEASSHVNYRYLDTPGKLQRMKNLHLKVRK